LSGNNVCQQIFCNSGSNADSVGFVDSESSSGSRDKKKKKFDKNIRFFNSFFFAHCSSVLIHFFFCTFILSWYLFCLRNKFVCKKLFAGIRIRIELKGWIWIDVNLDEQPCKIPVPIYLKTQICYCLLFCQVFHIFK
jgi:hypothetical protein